MFTFRVEEACANSVLEARNPFRPMEPASARRRGEAHHSFGHSLCRTCERRRCPDSEHPRRRRPVRQQDPWATTQATRSARNPTYTGFFDNPTPQLDIGGLCAMTVVTRPSFSQRRSSPRRSGGRTGPYAKPMVGRRSHLFVSMRSPWRDP